jgi:4-hydroxyacetophenone monooxygenase
VTALTWDEDAQQWVVNVRDNVSGGLEELRANVVVSAIGIFSRPKYPDIAGMAEFEGRIIHTAEWDPHLDLAGRRVATIGTGSSGVQLVGPLAEIVGELVVFQRSGTWVDPVPEYVAPVPDDEQWLLTHLPYYLNWQRILAVIPIGDYRVRNTDELNIDPEWDDPDTISAANKQLRDVLLKHVMDKIGDRPDLVAKCVPTYPPGTKRLPKDNGWFDALRRPDVALVDTPIECFTSHGLRTTDGKEYPVDVVVLASGFRASDYLLSIEVRGRGAATLAERWQADGARAYLGMTIPGFPNLFCLYGPNTNGRANSPCGWGELQSRYVLESIKYLIDHRRSSMEVREEVYDEYNRVLDERSRLAPWMDARQTSYYRNEHGRSATNGPFFNREYWPWTRRPNPDEYRFVAGTDRSLPD